jgi:hypothetical protein
MERHTVEYTFDGEKLSSVAASNHISACIGLCLKDTSMLVNNV